MEANRKEIEFLNKRYNTLKEDIDIGTNYLGEGYEITEFKVDENGRTTMEITEWYMNNQYAMRTRHHIRHPRFNKNEINYLLGRKNSL